MKIRFRSRGLPKTSGLRELAETRLAFALSRFAPRVREVTIRLEDENGPKGGVDKSCRVSVDLGRLGMVFVEDVDSNLEPAVCRAAERAGQSVARAVERAGRASRLPVRKLLSW